MLGDWGGAGEDLRHKVYRPTELFSDGCKCGASSSEGIRSYVMLTLVIDDPFCNPQCRIRSHLHGAKMTRRKSQLTEL